MKKYSKLIIVFLLVSIILPGIVDAAPTVENLSIKRLSGTGRIQTSIEVCKEDYNRSNNVILAGYNGEVDALTGTLLAAAKDAPVLLTHGDKIHPDLKAELERLKVKNIYILGGESVIHKELEDELARDYRVKRVAGKNREATAVAVAEEVNGQSKHIFLAKGNGVLADALAIGPVSAIRNMPVLLTGEDKVSDTTMDAIKDLGVTNITIVGGEGAINKSVEDQLGDYEINRISGSNRAKTALAIAEEYFVDSEKAIVANGYVFADALIAGYLGAKMKAPILLSNVDRISSNTKDYIRANNEMAYVLGGENSISKEVYKEIEKNLKITAEKLAEVKEALKLELETYVNSDNYKINKDKLKQAIAEGKVKIEKATTIEEIDNKLKEAKLVIDSIRSDDKEMKDESKIVDNLIADLPELDQIKITDKQEIGLARMAYDRLLAEKQGLVSNLNKLVLLENKISQLEKKTIADFRAKMLWPVPSSDRISSPFGYRFHPIHHTNRLHTGIDIPAKAGNDVVSAAKGVVIRSNWFGGYGNAVMIDHGGGIVTLYGHNSENLVSLGQVVEAGTLIARIGSTGDSTGPHSHFEVRKDGKCIDPLPWVR